MKLIKSKLAIAFTLFTLGFGILSHSTPTVSAQTTMSELSYVPLMQIPPDIQVAEAVQKAANPAARAAANLAVGIVASLLANLISNSFEPVDSEQLPENVLD